MKLIVDNKVDTATLTASPAVVSTLPVTYLQTHARSKVMRTTSLADQDIKLTWSSSNVFTAFAALRHNLTGAATWRIRIYSDAAWTTQVYDSGAILVSPAKALGELLWGIDPLGASVFTGWSYAFGTMWLPSPVAGQSVKITLSDATNPAGYMELCRLFAGVHIESNVNASVGMSLKWSESTKQTRTDGGTLYSESFEPYRDLDFSIDALTPDLRAIFVEASRKVGMRKDIFISVFPGSGGALERDYTMNAKFSAVADSVAVSGDRYAHKYSLQEA